MAVHNVIKVEIKQTKMNFFCLHFYPVFSGDSLTTHVLQKYVLEKSHIGVTSHFAYVEFRITRSIFAIPLDFEIARLTCIMFCCMHGATGIFLGYLRGRYKAPVPMANIHFFSQFDQKISQSEGQLYVDQ